MGCTLMWRVIRSSVTGISHVERGELCQDSCYADFYITPSREHFFIGIVSDGAGSASEGACGAELVSVKAREIIESWISDQGNNFDEQIVKNWIQQIRNRVVRESDIKGLSVRDFACTLLGAVVGPNKSAFFQIGDGAIIVSKGDSYKPVFWPDSGEYANMTFFLTDEDYLSHLRIEISESQDEIALFSDGLQHLALVYKTQSVHHPFFEPMFSLLRKENSESCCVLDEQLKNFLNSSNVNERTDDDKTLVLATRRLA